MCCFKRSFLAAVGLVLCASLAHADYYINWKIEDSGDFVFDYAKVSVKGAGYSAYLADHSGENFEFMVDGEAAGTSLAKDNVSGTQGYGTGEAVDTSSYNFQVELWSDAGGLLAKSTTASWATLDETFRCLNGNVMKGTGEGVWVASGFTAVPEPTSGLLLLLGVAGLALKRKRS